MLILPVAGDTFVISVADPQIFLFGSTARSWSVLSEVGKTSVWLSPLSWVCCFGRTSPTGDDRPWVQPPPVITAWPPLRKRDSHVTRGSDVIFGKGESLTFGRRCLGVTFSPAIAQRASCSDSCPLSIMQINYDSQVIAQWRLCAPGVCFPCTIWPFGHQAGAAAQSDNQGCSTIRPIIDNNRVQLAYSDSDFGLYPLSACLPRGLRPRHRRFKWRGAACSRWANSSKPPAETFFLPGSVCCY